MAQSASVTASTPLAQRVIDVALELGIDPTKEFYLLSVAKHALDSPDAWQSSTPDDLGASLSKEYGNTDALPSGAEKKSSHLGSQLQWFRKLVESERERYEQNPTPSSPWLRLRESSGKSYYYNFLTHKVSVNMPGGGNSAEESLDASTSEIEVMKFTSWWVENNSTKRFIYVNYLMRTEEFEINIDKDDKIYRLKTVSSKSGPAGCWDLHINTVLKVFGRQTTLMQCTAETRRWIVKHAKRISKVKAAVTKELAKYEVVMAKPDRKVPWAQMHLRRLMDEVQELKSRLSKYRPRVAAKFRI